ncbi:MAG: tRNA (5-methylaminomethyl-2-thiouridine)(34)-methyltransferase MnmD [Nitratireductor sp.]
MNDENALIWEDDTIPRAKKFDDTYYSKADGFLETEYVFIAGNNLIERWPNMSQCTIGELGFGTGLNFLVTALAWQKRSDENSKLKFISFEQYPLTMQQTKKALSRWPELNAFCQPLLDFIEHSNFENQGKFNLQFAPNIELELHLGDANRLVPKLEPCIDAWYLDGFSPAKNPELWNAALMQSVFDKTKLNGTFATYTAASFVRNALSDAGFRVTRTKGHAGKRHMSVGIKA